MMIDIDDFALYNIPLEDSHEVRFLFDWDDPEKALKYSQSEILVSVMRQSGVTEDPVLY